MNVERKAGLPVLMKPLSGNVSDPGSFPELIERHVDHFQNAHGFDLIASAIDKWRLKDQYDDPENPYHLALAFGLERIYYHLCNKEGCEDGTLHLVFEERGKREDDNLELESRRALDNNPTGDRLPFDIIFSSKESNAAELQVADLVARPIGRHLLGPEQPNRAYDVIKEKFRRSPDGEIRGRGLKVFP
jgi:hypothetical protein